MLYDENTAILYVGANNGMYAYKQNKFIPLTAAPNQIGNSFFNLKQNKEGVVFCNNMIGQIFEISGTEMKIVYEHPNSGDNNFNTYYINQNDEIIINAQKSIVYIKNGKIEIVSNTKHPLIYKNKENKIDTISHFAFGEQFNKKLFLNGYSTKGSCTVVIDENWKVLNLVTHEVGYNPIRTYINQSNKCYAICNNGRIENVFDSIYSTIEKQEMERVSSLNDSIVLGLSSQKGIRYFYLNNDTLTSSKTFFDNLFISTCTQLNSGVLLLGTFGEGILIVQTPTIAKENYEDLLLGIATSPENDVRISTRSGEIYEVTSEGLYELDKVPHNVDNVFYVPHNKLMKELGYKNFIYNDSRKQNSSLIDLMRIDSNSMLIGTRGSLSLNYSSNSTPKNLKYFYVSKGSDYTIFRGERVSSLACNLKDSTFYVSTNRGLSSKGWFDSTKKSILLNNKQFLVNDLNYTDELLTCGTEKEGVVVLKDEKKWIQLTEREGLFSNSVKQAELKDSLLYLISKNGFQIYNLTQKHFIEIGIKKGVEVEKITKFALSNDRVWLLEKHSYSSFKIDDIINNSDSYKISKLYIDSIEVNNQLIDYSLYNEFGYRENAFTFYFDYRGLDTKKETQIIYTLEGFYDNWKTVGTSVNKIEFQSLPIGSYTFKIKGQYREQTTTTYSYHFKILPPIWQRWWFYVLIGLFTASTIALIAVLRIRNISATNKIELEKSNFEKKAIDSQLKAIRAQMNPHFIFNSINSIQDLVLKEETLKSYDYLVLFSKMVRKTLEYSEVEFIPMSSEIDFLKMYLGLEKLRFKDEFEFEIKSTVKNKNILIPSIIIQPFVENAIKHGLLHKDGEKKILVEFMYKEGFIICVVTDNGVGHEEARRIKNRQGNMHQSFSTKAIEIRLELLKVQINSKAGYVSKTLYHSNGNVAGTEVIITLPIN